MRPVAIYVAPVGAELIEGNPLTAREIAEETIACARAGASLVHLHVRDEQGKLVEDTSVFKQTVDMIRRESDIIIQGSTGGMSDLSAAQRCTALQVDGVEVATLNLGSTNFGEGVYINSPSDIRYWAREMKARGIKPELQIFEPGMIETALQLFQEGLLEDPLLFNFALGFPGAMPATVKGCLYLSELVPDGAHWSVLHHGMDDFSFLAAALAMGAFAIRVGFEDSHSIGGYTAKSNVELVSRVARLVTDLGYRIMNPAETRRQLGLKS
ncbi:MAG TPA: 3-keto-5-aminohexanoate cleavage protein [Firmicutes bacterium]|nr:3-keto-5-aminohexanoate cleavage protein [Bacillota bacterium]